MSERYTPDEWEFGKVLYEARKLDAYGKKWRDYSWNVEFPSWRDRNRHYMVTENAEVDMALAQAKAGLRYLREAVEA